MNEIFLVSNTQLHLEILSISLYFIWFCIGSDINVRVEAGGEVVVKITNLLSVIGFRNVGPLNRNAVQ